MLPGSVLAGRYRLDAVIGQGGMGQVWRGFDLRLQRQVAIKVLLPIPVGEPEVKARFLREGNAAAQLDHHPAIAAVYDAGSHQDQPFLVLELLRGDDFTAVLAGAPDGLAAEAALSYAAQVADGLAAAHAAGIVHRDIKPSNLMLLPGGRVKICDFGIAHLRGASTTLTATGHAIGSPAYMAPEQWAGQDTNGRADLYSLGCVLHELLTGRPFHAGKPLATLPPDLSALVLRLLAQDPAQRPATAAAAAAELRAIADRYQKAADAHDTRIGDLLADAEHIARTIDHQRIRAELLHETARLAAGRNPGKARYLLAEAERIARTLDESWTLWELEDITLVMAPLDPPAAVRIARSLDKPNDQVDILVKAARAVTKCYPEGASLLLSEAAQITRTTVEPESRGHRLREIAGALAGLDTGKARELLADADHAARRLPGPWEQAKALSWNARSAVEVDRDYACLALADAEQLSRSISDPHYHALALGLIAETMAYLDLREAERIACSISEPDDQARGLLEVTRVAAAHDPGKAGQLVAVTERIAHTLRESDASWLLEKLAETAVGLDLDLAESIARTIENHTLQSKALVKIAKGAGQNPRKAQHLLDEARNTLGRVWNESSAKILSEIAQAIANHDPSGACELLAEAERAEMVRRRPGGTIIGNPLPELAKGTAKVASIVARHNPAEAERIALTIANESVRDDTLRDIATKVAPWNPAGAIRIVTAFSGQRRDEAIIEVIAVIAGADPGHAEQVARTANFSRPQYQAKALLAVAAALAQDDPYRTQIP